ncbi:MAG: hypothetical protein FJ404_18275 [Verrucomicrobia bacterium]|nr:hypothetical protein [Verrucomicrobiota bacterium]
MLPVMQVGRVRPGAPPEHDVLHPVGGGLEQARPTNNIGMHGRCASATCRRAPFMALPLAPTRCGESPRRPRSQNENGWWCIQRFSVTGLSW